MSEQQIPLKVRAAHVAYLRLTIVIEQLERIPRGAPKPPFACDAIQNLKRWQTGLYNKLKPYLTETTTDSE